MRPSRRYARAPIIDFEDRTALVAFSPQEEFVVASAGDYPADFHWNGRWWRALTVVQAASAREACELYVARLGHGSPGNYVAIDHPAAFDVIRARTPEKIFS